MISSVPMPMYIAPLLSVDWSDGYPRAEAAMRWRVASPTVAANAPRAAAVAAG